MLGLSQCSVVFFEAAYSRLLVQLSIPHCGIALAIWSILYFYINFRALPHFSLGFHSGLDEDFKEFVDHFSKEPFCRYSAKHVKCFFLFPSVFLSSVLGLSQPICRRQPIPCLELSTSWIPDG